MSEHTEGPWEAYTEPEFSGWWAIRQVTDDGLNHEVGSGDGGLEEADARLMASAPELLEALELMVESYESNLPDHCNADWFEDYNKAMAAIAKAKGE